MMLSSIAPLHEETNAIAYRRAHTGKLMIIRRVESEPTVASDFFQFDSVGTHPSGFLVTGTFQNGRRSHMMASRVRAGNEVEIAGETVHSKTTRSGATPEMSLESCDTCGRALSIVGAHCRNCVEAEPFGAARKTLDLKFAIPAAIAAAAGVALLLYEIVSR